MNLDDLLGGLGGVFGRVADEVMPTCACGAKAIPRKCFVCGKFACVEHAYVNAAQFATGGPEAVICAECATNRPTPQAVPQRPRNWHWGVLGLDPRGATSADVTRVVKSRALGCHPDRFSGDANKEREFKDLMTAKGLALEELKAKGK